MAKIFQGQQCTGCGARWFRDSACLLIYSGRTTGYTWGHLEVGYERVLKLTAKWIGGFSIGGCRSEKNLSQSTRTLRAFLPSSVQRSSPSALELLFNHSRLRLIEHPCAVPNTSRRDSTRNSRARRGNDNESKSRGFRCTWLLKEDRANRKLDIESGIIIALRSLPPATKGTTANSCARESGW